MPVRNYGNDKDYVIAWLRRDGFEQLANAVELGKLSARFAKELATTVPPERRDEVTRYAVKYGPRRPPHWNGWADFLDIVRSAEQRSEPENA